METFKEFTFEAAHKLPPHSGLHGHSFLVTVVLKGEQDPVHGWMLNLDDLERAVGDVQRDLNEKYLNDVPGLAHPSIENIAGWIWRRVHALFPGLDRVTVRRGAIGSGVGCSYTASDATAASRFAVAAE